jgi:integrase
VVYKSTGTTDKKQAEAIGMDWWTNGIEGKAKSSIDRKTLFCDYLIQFWDFNNSIYFRELETMGREPHPDHAIEMQKIVERYYRPYFQSKLLCQIDGETLQQFVVYLKIEKRLAASTVNSARNTAIVALRYAKRKKMIPHFDFDAVLRASGKQKERGTLEKSEVDKLFDLDWPNTLSRMAVLISYNTGIRMGEIRALKVGDIHENRITVEHSWSRKNKMKCTKNRETREIPILPWLYNEIMLYIKEMGLLKPDSLLFPGKNPAIPFDSKQIRKDFYKKLTEIGIDEEKRIKRGIVFHSWRHLIAKNISEKGVNKTIGMKILGHKTSYIFDRYAAHEDKETFDLKFDAIRKIAHTETSNEPIPFKEVV